MQKQIDCGELENTDGNIAKDRKFSDIEDRIISYIKIGSKK